MWCNFETKKYRVYNLSIHVNDDFKTVVAKLYIFDSLKHAHWFYWSIHYKTLYPLSIQQQTGKIYLNSVVDSSVELMLLPQNLSESA